MRDFFSDIDWSRWGETAWTTSARVVLVIVAVYIAVRVIQRLVGPFLRATVRAQMAGEAPAEVEKRIETLTHVSGRTIGVTGVFFALITILPEFGINAGALLAGAGVIGIAIGFGAQSLVRDVLGGTFILLENQYGRGDVIRVAGVGGVVEDVNLRRTLVRDLDGAVHSVPNGAIMVSSNLTRLRSRVNAIVSIPYAADLERAFAVINRVGQELAAEASWAGDITEAPKVVGVETVAADHVEVRVGGETQPKRQWDVTRELRRRLKLALDSEGLGFPSPMAPVVPPAGAG
jgi:small conductance mechanosensitive channel